tara:strand:- start:1507 stop:1920 length:414 start_codon:yes stop_codon:yes gene_type:complete
MIENIKYKKKTLAQIIRGNYTRKKGVNFFTDKKLPQQVAYINHKKNYIIQPHLHQRRLKKINDTTEVLIILKGVLKIDFYNDKEEFLLSKLARKNDIIILISGGHGFKTLKNCQMIEIKQGPYSIKKDKRRFKNKIN